MTKTHILRRFEPSQAEYEAIVRVYDAANPDEPGSADAWRHWDQHRDPARMFGRFVVEQGGEIGGYGWTMRRDPAANKFRFAIYFLPHWETVELIHDFYSYLRDHCLDSGAASLLCQTRENESAKIDWLQGQGYQEAMRYPRSILTYKLGAGIDILETGLTGVDRQYRRRGLATALKCQVIEVAQRLGARRILTSNEENNPMFQLNLRLGFEAQPAEVDWECAIT